MSNFESVFKYCLDHAYEVNEKEFGKTTADTMQLEYVKMKLMFERFYERGFYDGRESLPKETSQERLARIRSYNY